jgi:hypothetical protein
METTGSNYNEQRLQGAGTNKTAGNRLSTEEYFQPVHCARRFGSTSGVYSGGELLFPDALSTRSHKSMITFGAAAELNVDAAGRWASTAAVTSVTIEAFGDKFYGRLHL